MSEFCPVVNDWCLVFTISKFYRAVSFSEAPTLFHAASQLWTLTMKKRLAHVTAVAAALFHLAQALLGEGPR